jgi:hypothetical protein
MDPPENLIPPHLCLHHYLIPPHLCLHQTQAGQTVSDGHKARRQYAMID